LLAPDAPQRLETAFAADQLAIGPDDQLFDETEPLDRLHDLRNLRLRVLLRVARVGPNVGDLAQLVGDDGAEVGWFRRLRGLGHQLTNGIRARRTTKLAHR
jgi:hypothetical protein